MLHLQFGLAGKHLMFQLSLFSTLSCTSSIAIFQWVQPTQLSPRRVFCPGASHCCSWAPFQHKVSKQKQVILFHLLPPHGPLYGESKVFISCYHIQKVLVGKQTYLKQDFMKMNVLADFSEYFQDDWKFSLISRGNFASNIKMRYCFWEEESIQWGEAQCVWQRTEELYLH